MIYNKKVKVSLPHLTHAVKYMDMKDKTFKL